MAKISDYFKIGVPNLFPNAKNGAFSSRIQTLPNGGGSYQSPIVSPVETAAPQVPLGASVVPPAPIFNGGKPIAPVAPISPVAPVAPVIPRDPKASADAIFKTLSMGDVGVYSKTDFSNPNPTIDQSTATATELNNARNDIATGANDPYQWASKSGIPYTPAELKAIESASAGIFDPAIHSALARLDRSQKAQDEKNKLAEMAQKFKYDLALKQAPSGDTAPTDFNIGGSAVTPNTYTIQAGEDPYNIAQQNGITIEDLKANNSQITDWKTIQPGTPLSLPFTDPQNTWLNGKTPDQRAAYNKVPDTEKADIRQLVTGGALLTDIVKSRGVKTKAQIDQIVSAATAIDPKWTVQGNIQKNTYYKKFIDPNSKTQTQVNAINTGLGHLAEFKTAADALGNTIYLPYNKLVNFLNKNTGDPRVANLNTVIEALSGELATIYKNGTAPAQTEIDQWRNNLLSSFSKEQSKGVSNTASNLISSKVTALNYNYKTAMGDYPPTQIINPDTITQLSNAGVDTSPITNKLKSQGYNQDQTGQGPTPEEIAFLKSQGVSDAEIAKLK